MIEANELLCLLCGDTGKWSGSPEPCPDCGAFAPLRKNHATKKTKWRQQDNYRPTGDGFVTENRQMRRRKAAKQRKSRSRE